MSNIQQLKLSDEAVIHLNMVPEQAKVLGPCLTATTI